MDAGTDFGRAAPISSGAASAVPEAFLPQRSSSVLRPFQPRMSSTLLVHRPHGVEGVGRNHTPAMMAFVYLHSGRETVNLGLHSVAHGLAGEWTPDAARRLAWQLIDAADQVDSGGTKL